MATSIGLLAFYRHGLRGHWPKRAIAGDAWSSSGMSFQVQQRRQQQDRNFQTTQSQNLSHEIIKVEARGLEFQVSARNPNAKHAILCIPGALGTGPSDFAELLKSGLGRNGDDDDDDDQFGIFALDPRGLGGSSPHIPRDYPLDFYRRDAMDAAAVMEQIMTLRRKDDKNQTTTYSVMGWSDGAIVAIHLAGVVAPERVQSLVVWGGNATVSQQDVDAWEAIRNVNNWSERMRNDKMAVHGGMDRLQELNNAATDGWMRSFYESNGQVCVQELPHVQCPTLVVHGARDAVCHVSHAKFMANEIPNSRLVIMEEGKHNLHQRHANEFHRIVQEFIKENLPVPGPVDASRL